MLSEGEDAVEGPAELITQPGKQNLVPVGSMWPVESAMGEITVRTLETVSELR
jgi:hypothetical protein